MKTPHILTAAVLSVTCLAVAAQPAYAVCGSFRIISSIEDRDSYSYMYTPGFEDRSGYDASTISPDLEGSFWHVGNGDPVVGPGNDNGSLGALGGFIYTYPNYPAFIESAWSYSGVDGCINIPQPGGPPERCMAMLLTDTDSDGGSVFALLTAAADDSLNFFFNQEGNSPINLAPLPRVFITNSIRQGPTGVELQVRVPELTALAPGLYLDQEGDCASTTGGGGSTLIQGVQLRVFEQERGGERPSDLRISEWSPIGTPVPLGGSTVVSAGCAGDVNLYLSYSLLLDSGFETNVVANATVEIHCGPNLSDVPDSRPRVRDTPRHPGRTRGR